MAGRTRENFEIIKHGRRLGSAVAAFLVLSSCGASNHRFLADSDEKVYLRVPSGWHDVKLSDDIQDPLLQATSDARIISKQVVSTQEGAAEQSDLDGRSPIATMTVYETTGVFNQQLSPSLARKAVGLVSFDPVLPSSEEQDLAEVIDFDPNPTNADVAGSRVVYRVRSDADSDWVLTINLSTYFDTSESRLYALEVVCSPECYERDAGEITNIVNSWRID